MCASRDQETCGRPIPSVGRGPVSQYFSPCLATVLGSFWGLGFAQSPSAPEWRELMFADENLERKKHRDPVAAVERSEAAPPTPRNASTP
jgi:hypothetical protein